MYFGSFVIVYVLFLAVIMWQNAAVAAKIFPTPRGWGASFGIELLHTVHCTE